MMSGEPKISPPNRHWVALYTFVILLPLVYLIPPWVMAYVTDNHGLVTVVSVAIIVPIVSYLALPNCLKAHHRIVNKK